eukprot:CAMPEP_0118953706 /NCGR_PEP_ID=MMETSP1169-20130426/57045_1 /TAXON_ID=36882 /ORGANISM="Pyramimonas obovata, Strain CCMP722" /LENGTH=73 /DNA_ID=CAMNT_0006901227 /DNA_START=288 /DNA_END=509 /DNA_ORIENTATION=-
MTSNTVALVSLAGRDTLWKRLPQMFPLFVIHWRSSGVDGLTTWGDQSLPAVDDVGALSLRWQSDDGPTRCGGA